MTVKLRTLAGAAALFAAASALAADVPAGSAGKAAAADVTALQKKLDDVAAATDAKKVSGVVRTAKSLALMLAVYGDEGTKAQAGKVLDTLAAKDYKAAAAAGKKFGEKATGGPVALDGKYELDDVMSPFRPAKNGGLNIENDIRDGKKGKVAAADAEVLGARCVALAVYTAKLPNDAAKTSPAKTKEWEKLSADMGAAGKAVAEEAAKGDKANPAKLTDGFKKLDASCVNCHDKFRD